MDADVECFFEECRADPWFRERIEALDDMEETFEKFYREADESAAFQEFWDDIREIVTRRASLIERFKVLAPLLRKIAD